MSSKTKTTATKADATPALVPMLRFPEFRETDAWAPTTIGALGRFYYGKSAPKWSLSEDAPTPCVRYGELYTKFGPVITETYSRTNTDPETLRFSKGGEILIPRVGEKPEDFGTCCSHLTLKGIAIGEMISVLETKQHPLFYTYYFRNLYKQFAKVVEGQNVKNLYFAELEPLPIHRPSIPEQQKIAECLSSVDELIAAQARKLDALKTHKKGLMQQLFPREGETQPRLRFPEFQDAGEWTSAPLGQLLASSPDYGVNAAAVPFSEGLPKYLRITDISEDGTYLSDKMVSVDIEPTDGNYLDEGDIALARTGASVGKSYRYRKEDGRLVFAGFLIRIKPAKKKLVSAYIANFLTTDVYWDWVAVSSTRSGQPGLNSTEYSSFSIPLPPDDLSEQQRIADCLTSLDDLIAAQTQTLEALKTHKQGLMQQLFPSPLEVDA